jgi:rhodanese-related sulfurtransferase
MKPVIWKQIALEIVTIIMLSVVLAIFSNLVHPDSVPLFSSYFPPDPVNETPSVNSESSPLKIPIDIAIDRFHKHSAVFVDARTPADFSNAHIKGAVNLPEKEFESYLGDFLAAHEPDTPIITYCDGIDCPLAKMLAEKLRSIGYINASYMVDGWGEWKRKGLPQVSP